MSATVARRRAPRKRPSNSDAAGSRNDVYQIVTDQIVEMLEAGTAPWHKPWRNAAGVSTFPRSLSTGKPYRGINPFLLQVTAISRGYSSCWWGTYEQIQERGGQVRRGEQHTKVVFWTRYVRKAQVPGEEDREGFVLRYFRVFNADQADGLTLPKVPGRPSPDELESAPEFDPIAACEESIAAYFETGPRVIYGGNSATYDRVSDVIRMPPRESFDSPERYYGALFHEATHSTGHEDRLKRPDLLTFHKFGDPNYSREELVAEMGAAFLAGITGIDAVTLPSSASYLASWIRALKGDSKLVVTAAAQAQRATDLILGVKYAEAEQH